MAQCLGKFCQRDVLPLHLGVLAGGPVVALAGDEPDAHGVPPGHEPEPVVLDLMNPVGAGRGFVGGGREAGLDEFGVGGKPLTHTLDQHVTNLGSRNQESNRNAPP
jgi:hypothetical protein